MSLLLTRAILWAAVMSILTAAAAMDVHRRIIPNELVAVTAVGGLALGLLSRPGSIWLSLLIAMAVVVALAPFGRHNTIGGGDIKLIAAATLLVPPDRTAALLLYLSLSAGAPFSSGSRCSIEMKLSGCAMNCPALLNDRSQSRPLQHVPHKKRRKALCDPESIVKRESGYTVAFCALVAAQVRRRSAQ